MKPTTTIAIAWIATSLAVSVAIYITHSAWCLWVFILPGSLSYTSGGGGKGE
jgi:hypothetical protein